MTLRCAVLRRAPVLDVCEEALLYGDTVDQAAACGLLGALIDCIQHDHAALYYLNLCDTLGGPAELVRIVTPLLDSPDPQVSLLPWCCGSHNHLCNPQPLACPLTWFTGLHRSWTAPCAREPRPWWTLPLRAPSPEFAPSRDVHRACWLLDSSKPRGGRGLYSLRTPCAFTARTLRV